jgi:phage tail-like protein
VPLVQRLPGVFQDDDFTRRFVSAFDDAYAPVLATLDSLFCYFDPQLAPADFVDWLAGWVGVELDDSWTLEQRRRIVAGAALVHRQRGTRRGIEEALRLGLGADVEVVDSGGCDWSETPGATTPGTAPPWVEVRIRVPDPDALDRRRVDALLEATKPAHVTHSYTVEAPTVGAQTVEVPAGAAPIAESTSGESTSGEPPTVEPTDETEEGAT